MMSLKYENLSLQNHLKSFFFSKFEAQKLFRFRTYMEDFKENFRNGNENLGCTLCLKSDKLDSQSHFLDCSVINSEIPETKNQSLDDIFSDVENKIKTIIKIIIKAHKKRSELLLKN